MFFFCPCFPPHYLQGDSIRIELNCRTASWCPKNCLVVGDLAPFLPPHPVGSGYRKTGLKSCVCRRGWGGLAAGDKDRREPAWKTQSAKSEVLWEQINACPSPPFSISASPLCSSLPHAPTPLHSPLTPPPAQHTHRGIRD